MSIKKYKVLDKVIELGSLTKAAEQLGYTQSGVSHIINNLEEELGVVLLKRSRAGVSLTENGERIMPAIRGILSCNEQLEQTVADIHGLASGTVRIGSFTSVAVHWLPGMIKQFQQDYPNIELKLFNGDYHDVNSWLEAGAVDIGFVTLPADVNCECTPLHEDRLLAIVPVGHRLAGASSFPVAQMQGESFISLLESSDHDARRALENAGVHPDVRFTTKDDYAIIAMVQNGLGVSIMPELLLTGQTDGVSVMELEPPASRVIALAVHETGGQSPAARRFAEYVKRWVMEKYA